MFTNKFLGIPVILGANTDEGSFYMPSSIITTEANFVDLIASMFNFFPTFYTQLSNDLTDPRFYNVPSGIVLPRVLVKQLATAYSNVSSSPGKFLYTYTE